MLVGVAVTEACLMLGFALRILAIFKSNWFADFKWDHIADALKREPIGGLGRQTLRSLHVIMATMTFLFFWPQLLFIIYLTDKGGTALWKVDRLYF